jgi:hypothetical protein
MSADSSTATYDGQSLVPRYSDLTNRVTEWTAILVKPAAHLPAGRIPNVANRIVRAPLSSAKTPVVIECLALFIVHCVPE